MSYLPTMYLRWLKRGDHAVLQQAWLREGQVDYQWRDVPLLNEDDLLPWSSAPTVQQAQTRPCGHSLGSTRWCPECALGERK